MFLVKCANFLQGIINRFQIGIVHGAGVDLPLIQKLNFGLQIGLLRQLRKYNEPEQGQYCCQK